MDSGLNNRPLPYVTGTVNDRDVGTDLWMCRNAIMEQYVIARCHAERLDEQAGNKGVWWTNLN
jgi:hypothetical protein